MKSLPLSILFALTLSLVNFSPQCIASNSPDLPRKQSVQKILKKVSDWQIKNFTYSKTGKAGFLHDYGIDAWTNSTLYVGMEQWAKIAGNSKKYYDWLYNIGEDNKWVIPANFIELPKYGLYHADELCIGQFYLNMYDVYKEKKMIDATIERADYILSNPPNSDMSYKNKQSWTWCDALFMAPPVYLHLGILTGDAKYIQFMDEQFKNTYNHLYNKEERLFFRDDSYFDKKEANGQKVFWGRGNGWAAAGLVNILKLLPEDSSYRPYYEELFAKFIPRFIELQDKDGFWHASLLDPDSYPSPETSATALITYALAYGINSGLLDKSQCYPATIKAWKALSTAVDENGKLGWVQPIGADPKKVDKSMTAVYGVGAFLLAGTEIYKLTDK